eukprot:TRINITY_DN6087_c0_g1_i1.p1 TRINITY_DN6087_c0_g1~~TRINITY_DN6087_c0_g1_i1.p1  ORF type:complete len:326 (+),score=44.66 TRINITY_DN6087_c0_g1_i1:288-1265(+)
MKSKMQQYNEVDSQQQILNIDSIFKQGDRIEEEKPLDIILDPNFYHEELVKPIHSYGMKQSSDMINQLQKQQQGSLWSNPSEVLLFEAQKKQKLLLSKEINMLGSSRKSVQRLIQENYGFQNMFTAEDPYQPNIDFEHHSIFDEYLQNYISESQKQQKLKFEQNSNIFTKLQERTSIPLSFSEIKKIQSTQDQQQQQQQQEIQQLSGAINQLQVPKSPNYELQYAIQKFPRYYLIIIEICLENSLSVARNYKDYFRIEEKQPNFYCLHLQKLSKLKPLNYSSKTQIFSNIDFSEINSSIEICKSDHPVDIISVQYESNFLMIKIG